MAAAAAAAAAVPRGKRKQLDSSVIAYESESNQPAKKSKLQSNDMNTSGNGAEEEEVDVEMKDAAESSSPPTSSTASSTPTTPPPHPLQQAYSSVKDKEAINTLLRQPLPNVLADMVTDYLSHPMFDLWEEIISVYESLPQMPKDKKKIATAHQKKHQTSQNELIELMPKLQLSPSASPMDVDELEQQFQLKYDDPNFHFSSELKFLWSIANGLEASQNMIFRGRFWPSLTTMRAILECPENSYYVMYHHHAQHMSAWLKYDFRSNTFYATGSDEDQQHPFEEIEMVIIYHSITHFLKVLLASLKVAALDPKTYRIPRDRWGWRQIPGDPHPPAIEVGQTRGFVLIPPFELPIDWEFLLLDEFVIQSDDVLIPGHLSLQECVDIRKSICAHENQWAERLLNKTYDELWERRVPPKKSSHNDGLNDDDEEEEEEEEEDEEEEVDEYDVDSYQNRDYRGFPRISDCHLLDAMDNYAN